MRIPVSAECLERGVALGPSQIILCFKGDHGHVNLQRERSWHFRSQDVWPCEDHGRSWGLKKVNHEARFK